MGAAQAYEGGSGGGGAAGCVLANRLRADPWTSVPLLKAGGSGRRFMGSSAACA